MLDLSKMIVPDCITCGTKPIVKQRPSMHKTREDDYKEWHESNEYSVVEIECPKCGRYTDCCAMNQKWVDANPDYFTRCGWTKKYHHFVGCQAHKDENDFDEETGEYDDGGCSDNEGFVCEECPHWRTTTCNNCGCSDFEFLRKCTPEDDAENYDKKCMWKCAKCGKPIRVWNF